MSTSKSTVTITIDRDNLRDESQQALLVTGIGDYARVCRDISHAIHHSIELDICVRDPYVDDWLSKFVAKYSAEHARIIRLTPRHALAERWNITIPDDVTDNEILDSGVLNERIFPTFGQSFEDIILQHYFGGEFSMPSLQIQRLDVLLNSYDEAKWSAALSLSLVSRVFREKLILWENNAKNDDARFLVNCLADDPAALRQDLINFKILKNYPPEQGEKVLLKKWKLFQKRHIETDGLFFHPKDAAEVATNVDYYLANEKNQITDAEKLLNLLGQMSGYLNREFYVVHDLLREHPEWVSEQVLSKLEERFAPIIAGLRRELEPLRQLIKPNFPSEPEVEWEAAKWLDWVSTEYMPYYAWLEAQGSTDEIISTYSARFGDWFYENFSALKNSEQNLFEFASLSSERERIRTEGTISLVLLMDNLNLVHFDALCRSFNRNGLTLETVQPKFSLIPTATEVNKAALISMQGYQVDTPTDSYSAIVEKVWGNMINDQTARYLSKIGELQDMQELNDSLLFLNYLPIDEALHKDASHTGQSHTDVISHSLGTLAKAVAAFAEKFQIKERLNIYVLSDHGSTRIAKTAANILDKNFYKGIAADKHHRYLALDDDKFVNLPQVADAQCYLLDRHKFGTNKNFIAARGYYRFADTSETFFVHGGLSPEEVVVPFARFSFATIEPQPLTITLLKNEYRYAVKSQIAFEVGNPNAYDLTNVSLSVIDAESEEVILPVLKAKQLVDDVGFTTIFHKASDAFSKESTRHLTLRCRFKCQGRSFAPDDVTFDITLKAMMEVIDDGFDF